MTGEQQLLILQIAMCTRPNAFIKAEVNVFRYVEFSLNNWKSVDEMIPLDADDGKYECRIVATCQMILCIKLRSNANQFPL